VSEDEARLVADGLSRALEKKPAEIAKAIASAGGEMPIDEALAWIGSFRDFNELAATHGGYSVD
jgi:hypothetical protein